MFRQIITNWKLHKFSIIMVLLSIGFYASFAFDLDRTNFIKLLSLYAALFLFCFKLLQFQKYNFKFLLITGIVFRLVFYIVEPNLSQDYFRFIWDGELLTNGQNPYLYLPKDLITQPNLVIANAQELFVGMGDLSPKFYSNYPPLNQLVFALASLLGGKTILGSVIVMRSILLLADIGIVYFGTKLLKKLNKAPHLIFWYFLNPLIVIELTGNLHFEGLMLFFLVWSLHLLSTDKYRQAGVIYALSILVKLVPLLFLPLFLNHFKLKKSIAFYVIIGSTTLAFVAPFYSPEFVANYTETVGLWFSNFEFNASIYNLIKVIAVDNGAKPWELIKLYGKFTPIITIAVVFLFTFIRKNKDLNTLITSMLWVLTIYYFISPTVHPWYLVFLVFLSVFTNYRYAILWSITGVLSYYAYGNPLFTEHLGLLAIEYLTVFSFMTYELVTLHNKK